MIKLSNLIKEDQDFKDLKTMRKTLIHLKIPLRIDTSWMQQLTGVPSALLQIINPKNRKPMYLGYDRSGWVLDGPGAVDSDMDQVSASEVISYLRQLFNK